MSSDDQPPKWDPAWGQSQFAEHATDAPTVQVQALPTDSGPPKRPALTTRGVAVVAVAVLLLGAGGYTGWHLLTKTGGANPVVTPTTTPKVPAALAAWAQSKIHPVTPPVSIGDKIVVYTAESGVLTLRIINPTTGATVWSAVASPSRSTAGEPFVVAHKANVAYYYAPSGNPKLRGAALNAIDVTTTKSPWTSKRPAHAFIEMPSLCADGLGLCVSAAGGATTSRLRISLTDGSEKVLSAEGGRTLGTGVTDPGGRSPEYIEHLDDATGKVAWKVPVNDLAGSPVSSDGGWDWDQYGNVYVGWLAATQTPSAQTVSFANEQSFGVNAATGARLWKLPGMYGCPVQGLLDNGKPIPVRCLIGGTATMHTDGSPPTFKGLDVTMQGFNPKTGATTWTAHLGNLPAALGISTNGVVRVGGHVFALTDGAGHTKVIDLATGKVTAADTTTPAWCLSADATWDWAYAPIFHGHASKYATNGLAAPCSETKKAIPASDGTDAGIGATAGGYFVWSAADGLHGLKVTAAG